MKIVKSVILATMLTFASALPVFAAGVADITDPTQRITVLRSQEIPAMPDSTLAVSAKIFNLEVEIAIHKMKVEPDTTFRYMVQSQMLPMEQPLTMKGKQLNRIALMSMYGLMDDDAAIQELQALSLVQ